MEKYEKIQEENNKLLKTFEEWLLNRNYSRKAVKRLISDVDLFINQFIAMEEEISPREVDGYNLDYFFRWCIDKWMLNTASGLISVVSSIQLFYEYLNDSEPLV